MTIYLVSSGDSRPSANEMCWPAQAAMEEKLISAIRAQGAEIKRAHAYDDQKKHGFIDGQRRGIGVFRTIPADAPVVVAEAVWQYSSHVLAGLNSHRGPILTVANWSGQWPGLVGVLNLNASLVKSGVRFSTLWSKDFDDPFFLKGLVAWIEKGSVQHNCDHVKALGNTKLNQASEDVGGGVAQKVLNEKALLGVFDEGCMGMYNAIIPDDLLHRLGIYKERLSQSSLYYEVTQTSDADAQSAREWLRRKGLTFRTGKDTATELTEEQIASQLKMYVAALRLADHFGCDAIGIQYQQGLKDVIPASDLCEGLLNNTDRPPVTQKGTTRILFEGQALPHFNEVDECAGVDALLTNRIWRILGYDPETTLHDLRYGETYGEDFVWVFQISGAAPPAHFIGGYEGAVSERQPPMYFPLGGGTLKGVSKPGEIVWSRIFVENNELCADIGRASVVELPAEETERRWQMTTRQWPIMHAVLHGVTRDQMMARHRANHIQVAYAPSAKDADLALAAKAACFRALGIRTFLCGTVKT